MSEEYCARCEDSFHDLGSEVFHCDQCDKPLCSDCYNSRGCMCVECTRDLISYERMMDYHRYLRGEIPYYESDRESDSTESSAAASAAPRPTRCAGITKRKKPCKLRPIMNSSYCRFHRPASDIQSTSGGGPVSVAIELSNRVEELERKVEQLSDQIARMEMDRPRVSR